MLKFWCKILGTFCVFLTTEIVESQSLPEIEILELPSAKTMRTHYIPAFVRYEPYLNNWFNLEEGLDYAEFNALIPSKLGDNRIRILKADPKIFNLKLLSISELKEPLLTGPDWLDKYQLKAVINAGMFKRNYKTSVSYMKNFKHLNNRKHKKQYQSYLAFNPNSKKNSNLSPFTIIESDQKNFKKELKHYNSVVQNMRLIDTKRQNLWTQNNKKWSISAIAQDLDGNILLIFSRSPFSVHDFNENLLGLPLNVKNAAYLEGGPVCFLGLSTEALVMNETGSFESGLIENNSNRKFCKVPNVLGLVRRDNDLKIVEAAKQSRKRNHD